MDDLIFEELKSLIMSDDDNSYDRDLLLLINGEQLHISQLIDVNPMQITPITTWRDWIGDDVIRIGAVKILMQQKIVLLFDPPNASMTGALERQIKELEWRLTAVQEED